MQFPESPAYAARPHMNGHASTRTSLSKRALCTADFTRALGVQAHRTDTESTLHVEFVVCGQFPDSPASHQGLTLMDGHPIARSPLSKRALCTADITRAIRVQAHRRDTESTLPAEFVACGDFSDRLPQQGLALMLTQSRARRSAKERYAQQTTLGCLVCKHTGQTRKAHCRLNSSYAGNFLRARLPQQGLTLMATHARARRSAEELSAKQSSHGRIGCRHTGQTQKGHCKLNSLYAAIS